jgi:predicted TIM-barrel fold metal-dependent hydrolase
MRNLQLFDCNAMLGKFFSPPLGHCLGAVDLEQEYREVGIQGGLVYHASARDEFPSGGNLALTEELEGHPDLHPAWVAIPHHTGEMVEPVQLAQKFKQAGVKAARIFCGETFYTRTLDPFVYGPLLEMFEHYHIPVIVEFDTAMSGGGGFDALVWKDLEQVCRSLPELRLILASPKITGVARYLFRLMEIHNYFAIDMSGFQLFGGLEIVARHFGANRILFGTRLPYADAAAQICALQYSDLDFTDQERIAGGNLRRLLKEVCL